MKKNLSKGIITFVFLLSNLLIMAQPGPGSEDNSGLGNLEGLNDPMPTSIDTNFFLIIIVAILFAFYNFIKKNNSKVAS